MSFATSRKRNFSALFLLFGIFVHLSGASATTLSGLIIYAGSQIGIDGACVSVIGTALGSPTGSVADSVGRYVVNNLPSGDYLVTASHLGHRSVTRKITINGNQDAHLDFILSSQVIYLSEVVTTVSRRIEKVTKAPAAVYIVPASQIESQPSITPVEHIKGLPEVDMFSYGISQKNVVTRGFNNIFSGLLLSLTDNRPASLPALRANNYNFYPLDDLDIDRIEVVSGPASALYGPNSANGVLHIITKSPFDSLGMAVSLGGGERQLRTGAFRYAGVFNSRLGYKISGEYYAGLDWKSSDPAEPDSIMHLGTRISNARNFNQSKLGGEARLDYRVTDDLMLILDSGTNLASDLEATPLGWGQAKNWRYSYVQGRALLKDAFIQAYYNWSDAGDSRLLRPDSLSKLVDKSSLFGAQAQMGLKFGRRERLTYGVDLGLTRPNTGGTIYGRNESHDDLNEYGAYIHSETAISDKIDGVLAGRVDYNNRLPHIVFSPRAALVYRPDAYEAIRLTGNRAFGTPRTSDLFLDMIAASRAMDSSLTAFLGPKLFDVWGKGVPESGYHFRFVDGQPQMISLYGGMLHAPGAYLAPNVNSVWPALRALAVGSDPNLDSVLPTTLSQTVAGMLMSFNNDYDKNRPLGPDNQPFVTPKRAVTDVDALKETTTSTLEFGYKGQVAERWILEGNVYQSRIDNFIGPLEVESPHVFINPDTFVPALAADITPRLIAAGMPADQAQTRAVEIATELARNFGPLPIGLISPQEIANATDVIVTYRNYRQPITLYGGEIGVIFVWNQFWRVSGNFSYVDKDFIAQLDNLGDVSMNAPKSKYAANVTYAAPSDRYDGRLQICNVGGFRSVSGIAQGDVSAYTVLDLNLGYNFQFRIGERLRISLTALNVLDNKHIEFADAPKIGRLVFSNLTYRF